MPALIGARRFFELSPSTGVGGYDPAASAFFARLSPAPTAPYTTYYNTLFKALRAAGLLSVLDCLWMLAANQAQWARQNLIQDAFNLTAVNSPAFTTDRGYAGDGSTSYLATGFIPSSAGGKYALNSASIGVGDRTSRSAATQVQIGATDGNTSQIVSRNTGDIFNSSINLNANPIQVANTNNVGRYMVSRTASGALAAYKDAASVGTSTQVSSVRPSVEFYLLGRNQSGVLSVPTSDQLWFGFIGGGLDATQAAALDAALLTFGQSVGAA